MASSGFHWVISPEKELIPNINAYGKDALVAVRAVGEYWGQQVQDDGRKRVDSEHLWVTRTGAAQGGLFFAVDGFGFTPITGIVTPEAASQMSDVDVISGDKDTLIITFGHTVYYGKFLELSNGGAHAVVLSTMERNFPSLERMLKDTFK